MKKFVSQLYSAMLKGLTTFLVMAMPVLAIANASPQPLSSAKSFGVEEYFSMLANPSRWDSSWLSGDINHQGIDPVEFVKMKARAYGFDAKQDEFSLVMETNHDALVRVRHNDKMANVFLKRQTDEQWTIITANESKEIQKNMD
jgi:hypothetical protein